MRLAMQEFEKGESKFMWTLLELRTHFGVGLEERPRRLNDAPSHDLAPHAMLTLPQRQLYELVRPRFPSQAVVWACKVRS